MFRSKALNKIPTSRIIETLVERFNEVITLVDIVSITDLTDGTYMIELCRPTYLMICHSVSIDGVEYSVQSVEDKLITIKGSSLPVGEKLKMPNVMFYNGTPIMVAQELDDVSYSWDKLPMIYLYEKLKDDEIDDVQSCFDRIANLRMYFMAYSDMAKWCTSDHYDNAIDPMYYISRQWLDFLSCDGMLGNVSSLSTEYHANFTVHANINGNIRKLFNDELSGVELNFKLPIDKILCCNDCC